MKGKIYLIPCTLGDTSVHDVLPRKVFDIIDSLDYFIVENIRSARRFIRKVSANKNIDAITFFELNKKTNELVIPQYLKPLMNGNDIGIISEAGNPGIADPGNIIVSAAHKKQIKVEPLTGPSSILLALISSGLNGQNFAFNGYLPVQSKDRAKAIQSLETKSRNEKQSQIFMETPYRNMKMLEDILRVCNSKTSLCIAADITMETEYIQTKTISEWKKSIPDLNKRPAIFIIQSY
jgi:16S rRNA (cytidine1402-2'-O)-methyltransferase